MKKPKKILLISLIVILVLWFGSNFGLYLVTKHIVVGEDRLALFNKVPETIEIKYKESDGQKIYFGNIELRIAQRGFDSAKVYPSVYIDEQDVEKYSIYLILMFKYANERKTITIDLNNTDLKLVDSYIEFSNYTINDFSLWNTLHNYNSFYKLAAKAIILPSNNDLETYPLTIVNTKYLKAFWTINSRKKTSSTNIEFSKRGKSYTIFLFGSDQQVITDDMKNILSSIKPIEDNKTITQELLSRYKEEESIFKKQLSLISLISIEGPTIENLTKLKKLLIQKGAREENIEDIQEQIKILKTSTTSIPQQNQ